MPNANVRLQQNNTAIQRKQNKHLGIKEDLHTLFGHIGSV